MIRQITDIEAFQMFNVDVAALVRNTNSQVSEQMQLDPNDFLGVDLWACRTAKGQRNIIDDGAMSPDELRRMRTNERQARATALADKLQSASQDTIDAMENGNMSLTDLIDPPVWI